MYTSQRGFQHPARGMFVGGGQRRWNSRAVSSKQDPSPLPLPDTSQKLLRAVKAEEVLQSVENAEVIRVKDCQVVASYNWLEKEEGAILVPGKLLILASPINLTSNQG